jgi:hypothetical protein
MFEQESVDLLAVDVGVGCREREETVHHRPDVLGGNPPQLLNYVGDRMRRHRRPPLAPLHLAAAPRFLTVLDGSIAGCLRRKGMRIDERLEAAFHVAIDLWLASERLLGLQECLLRGLDILLERVNFALDGTAQRVVVDALWLVQFLFQSAEVSIDPFDVLGPSCWSVAPQGASGAGWSRFPSIRALIIALSLSSSRASLNRDRKWASVSSSSSWANQLHCSIRVASAAGGWKGQFRFFSASRCLLASS